MVTLIHKTLKFVLPVIVIAVALLAARQITSSKPEPRVRDSAPRVVAVDAIKLAADRYQVIIRSQGTVQPTLANTLVPAVDGTVTAMSEDFVAGGAFKEGDLLLQVDPRDYDIALTQAQANVAQSDAQLLEQQALADQAVAEWRSLGRNSEPTALTLRKPQLAAARADRAAALAQVKRAELDLERTRLTAPYDGVVTERTVDPGQFVGRGAPVGSIHSTHAVDVSLALSNRQLTYLDLPSGATGSDAPAVEVSATIGATLYTWVGSLLRAEGIDATTRQLNVIARINDPYSDPEKPLRVGQFVEVMIEGQILEDVYIIPRSALREANEVLVIDADNKIQRRTVQVRWSDDSRVVVGSGLQNDELLVTTPLSTVADGTPAEVSIDGAARRAADS